MDEYNLPEKMPAFPDVPPQPTWTWADIDEPDDDVPWAAAEESSDADTDCSFEDAAPRFASAHAGAAGGEALDDTRARSSGLHAAALDGWDADVPARVGVAARAQEQPEEDPTQYNSADEHEPPATRPRLASGLAGVAGSSAAAAAALGGPTGAPTAPQPAPAASAGPSAAMPAPLPLRYPEPPLEFERRMALQHGLALSQVLGDGNCLFRCVASAVYGDQEAHATVRIYRYMHIYVIYS